MIQVSFLSKSYGSARGIKDVSFEIKKGQVVGFLGPNGAGKTTTMKLITGALSPTSGKITVGGFDMSENSIEARKHIGYLPEVPPLYEDLEVGQYLFYVGRLQGVNEKDLNVRVQELLESLNLKEVETRLVQNLSKGFRQRVGLAQALISKPEVLILDEPTSGLDPKQVSQMRQLINSLKGQHTLIISSHILSEVEALCDRVIIMKEGRTLADGTLDDLKNKARFSVFLRVARPSDAFAKDLSAIEGVKSVEPHNGGWNIKVEQDSVEKISQFAVNSGLLELSWQGQNLENIFMDIVN